MRMLTLRPANLMGSSAIVRILWPGPRRSPGLQESAHGAGARRRERSQALVSYRIRIGALCEEQCGDTGLPAIDGAAEGSLPKAVTRFDVSAAFQQGLGNLDVIAPG